MDLLGVCVCVWVREGGKRSKHFDFIILLNLWVNVKTENLSVKCDNSAYSLNVNVFLMISWASLIADGF